MTEDQLRVCVFASEPQYAHHLRPVWEALGPAAGPFLGPGATSGRTLSLDRMPVLVASWKDLSRVRRLFPGPIAYMEHGCGQSYGGDPRTARHPSYAGGDGREGVGLILAPNESSASRWRERYPRIPVHVIGATRVLTPPEDLGRPSLVVSFHWPGALPEQRNTLDWYRAALPRLWELGVPILGHSHPRLEASARRVFLRYGIPYEPSLDRVAQVATIYAVDNSSTLWELGRTRPTIALNAPWYRRHVHHGLRFWSHAGLQVDDGEALVKVARRLLEWGETAAERTARVQACLEVIPALDGAQRAARLLTEERWTTGSV